MLNDCFSVHQQQPPEPKILQQQALQDVRSEAPWSAWLRTPQSEKRGSNFFKRSGECSTCTVHNIQNDRAEAQRKKCLSAYKPGQFIHWITCFLQITQPSPHHSSHLRTSPCLVRIIPSTKPSAHRPPPLLQVFRRDVPPHPSEEYNPENNSNSGHKHLSI